MIIKKILIIMLVVSILITGCSTINKTSKTQENSEKKIESMKKASEDEPKKQIEKNTIELTKDHKYYDGNMTISYWGMEETDCIKTKDFTDKPSKGKKFLILYLRIDNNEENEFYFHPDYLSAKIDGKDSSYKIIQNEPNSYKTLFRLYSGGTNIGFVVYEVDKNWKNIELEYTGMEFENGNIIHMTFTPEDLQKPEILDDIQ